ncbi:MAG: biotin transporter BioY [Pseudomonadota bacterium]
MNAPISTPISLFDHTIGRRASWPLQLGLVVGASLLLWAAAKVQIPFYPVPLTLQTLALFLIAATLGFRLGTAAVLLYLAQGAMGLPVFAGTPEKGVGLAYMAGPTGGYLLGYLLATGVVGWCADRGLTRTALGAAAIMLAATMVMYAPGLAWLGVLFGFDQPILAWGLTPFMLGDALKLALAAGLAYAATRAVRRGA